MKKTNSRAIKKGDCENVSSTVSNLSFEYCNSPPQQTITIQCDHPEKKPYARMLCKMGNDFVEIKCRDCGRTARIEYNKEKGKMELIRIGY